MAKYMLGQFRHSLDDKNRVRIPAKFREGLGHPAYIIPGRAGCLYIVSEDNFENFVSRFTQADAYLDDATNDVATAFMMAGEELSEDAQGRVLFSKSTKEIASIDKEVVFVGKATYVEVWSAETFDKKFGVLNPDKISKMLESLRKQGV